MSKILKLILLLINKAALAGITVTTAYILILGEYFDFGINRYLLWLMITAACGVVFFITCSLKKR